MTGMTPTPTTYQPTPGASPIQAEIDEEAAVRARAHGVLTDRQLTVDDLLSRLPLGSVSWHRKIAATLAGETKFTSLTLALFAEATGTEVNFLLTRRQRPTVTIHACRVDETGGAVEAVAAMAR